MEEIDKLKGFEEIDSIEIGTPSKGGAIKVYFNSNDLEKAKQKIDNIFTLRQYADVKHREQQMNNGGN